VTRRLVGAWRTRNGKRSVVCAAHNVGAGTHTISAFNVSPSGELRLIGVSPFADEQTAPCSVAITHDGRFLFTVNT
jgi:6-phosphogluconolactonase (cycloisomerase 2 family)